MKNKTLYNFYNTIARTTLCGTMFVFIACGIMPATAAVVNRAAPAPTQRPASQRMPTLNTKVPAAAQVTASTAAATTATAPVTETPAKTQTGTTTTATTTTAKDTPAAPYNEIIEDKTSQFDAVLESATTGTIDASTQSLADLIRAQRAALDAAAAEEFSSKNTKSATAGLSACDSGLRACMQEKCGSNFLKCSGDGDTIWGNKMDACRRNVTCSGEEYKLFSIEIKADRDLNAKMSGYQKILDCGNSYNSCIEEQCGATFSKCLGKAAGDAAISKCASIARDCTQQDSGLASRAMQVFATLRQDAEKQVKQDEERLYKLRDTMRSRCQSLGALFDDRSLDCVFTVEFWAGTPTTSLYASKKAYAGTTFDCTQNWFGVDITTFKENAYRLTREQTSASSALLGAGVGMAVGSVTSGAINRAIDRHKADQAVKKAGKEDEAAKKSRAATNKDATDNKPADKKKDDQQTGKTALSTLGGTLTGATGTGNGNTQQPTEQTTPATPTEPKSEEEATPNPDSSSAEQIYAFVYKKNTPASDVFPEEFQVVVKDAQGKYTPENIEMDVVTKDSSDDYNTFLSKYEKCITLQLMFTSKPNSTNPDNASDLDFLPIPMVLRNTPEQETTYLHNVAMLCPKSETDMYGNREQTNYSIRDSNNTVLATASRVPLMDSERKHIDDIRYETGAETIINYSPFLPDSTEKKATNVTYVDMIVIESPNNQVFTAKMLKDNFKVVNVTFKRENGVLWTTSVFGDIIKEEQNKQAKGYNRA